jgi:hypothetical protein
VLSDYPSESNGWIKGWLPDFGNRKYAIVASHSNPAINPPNNRVYVIDSTGQRIYRDIIVVDRLNVLSHMPQTFQTLKGNGDITIVELNEPFPDTCKVYSIGKIKANDTIAYNRNAKGKEHSFVVTPASEYTEWIGGAQTNQLRFEGGDSGTIWFNSNEEVITHTARGMWGEGPNYGHPRIKSHLEKKYK